MVRIGRLSVGSISHGVRAGAPHAFPNRSREPHCIPVLRGVAMSLAFSTTYSSSFNDRPKN